MSVDFSPQIKEPERRYYNEKSELVMTVSGATDIPPKAVGKMLGESANRRIHKRARM